MRSAIRRALGSFIGFASFWLIYIVFFNHEPKMEAAIAVAFGWVIMDIYFLWQRRKSAA